MSKTAELRAQENSLAILGFENKTGDENLAWLETGLPEILLTDLAQTEALHLIGRERILDCFKDRTATHSFDEFVEAAKSLGGVRVLSGSIFKFGDQIRIDARLEDITTGKIIMAEKVMGDDPFPLVDSLISKIALSLDLSEEFTSDLDRARLTSTSSDAYRLYHTGLDLLFKDRHTEAINHFERAIAVDSAFALPYMRIGMVHFFEYRRKEGKKFLAEAYKRWERLPLRDKMLLDIYHDIWLTEKYDQGFTMMKSFVSNYPEDKEARTIYALLINVFHKDTTAAFAHFDTVLSLDPTYQFALEQYSTIYQELGLNDRAVEYAEKLLEYHPDSPDGLKRLASLYADENEIDKAISTYKSALDKFANEDIRKSVLPRLVTLSIRKRDFESANSYNEQICAAFIGDPYEIKDYYNQKANLLNWKGKFAEGMKYRHEAVKAALTTGDSISIYINLISFATYFYPV
ncbi:MAG: tetratricopeptide repeat protein [bacterium]|nr:tetratricopeptide repeat protein [bacterium]